MSEYIERKAAIAVIEEKQKELCPVGMYSRHAVYGSDREKFDAWQEIIDTLESIPAADVRPVVRGKWEVDGHHIKCSICSEYMCIKDQEGAEIPREYCPNCGANMGEC